MNYFLCSCGQSFFNDGIKSKCPKCKKIIFCKNIENVIYDKEKKLKIFSEKTISLEV